MKGILHSKKFKKNLYKWIISYLIVIGLFATVVTYSKYISSMHSGDVARAAKFNAKISYLNSCSNESEFTTCEYGFVRPTEPVNIYFKVDTSEIEVLTDFLVSVSISGEYSVDKVYMDNVLLTRNTDYTVTEGNRVYITETINPNDPNQEYVKTYHVIIKYKYETIDPEFNQNYAQNNVVQVAWSATQRD